MAEHTTRCHSCIFRTCPPTLHWTLCAPWDYTAIPGRRIPLISPASKPGQGRIPSQRGDTHSLFEFSLLLQGHGVSLSNNWDDVHYFAEMFHELQVQRPQAVPQEGTRWKGSLFTLLTFHPNDCPSIRAPVNLPLHMSCLLPPCSHLLPIHSALSQKTQQHFSRSCNLRPFQAPQHPKLN